MTPPPSEETAITDGPGAVADPLFRGSGEVGRFLMSRDWAATSVGPPQTWPPELRSVVRIMMTSRFSMWMGWGPELAFFYNDAYRRDTLRSKHPWALGRPSREVWAEIWDDIGPRIQSVLETGEATWDEGLQLFLERSGYLEETYHTFSYSPLSDEQDRIMGFLCVVTETTERVLSERRLQILSELGDISAVSAPTVVEACTAALAVLERGRRDVPFASIYLVDPGGATARRAAFYGLVDDPRIVPTELDRSIDWPAWKVLADGRAGVITGLAEQYRGLFTPLGDRVAGPRGDLEPDTVVAVPLAAGGGGEPVGVLFAGVSPLRALDTEYRRFLDLVARQVATALADAAASQAQRRRADELAELDRAKTEFFTGVSHELRTPLTLITGPAEDSLADQDTPLPPTQRARLELIARNSGRLRRLVDTILDFARLEGGRLVPDRVPVDLAALTRGIAESFAPAILRAGLGFTIDCPDLPSAVAVDVAMWEKIVLNLLSNAAKYTLAGHVAVALRPAQVAGPDPAPSGGLHLVVSDTGIGIPRADLPLVFERFHRVQGSAGRSHEGSGIGLALVAELVALHEGAVTVASTLGHGSEFTVSLPASVLTGARATGRQSSGAVQLYREEALQWGAAPADAHALPTSAGATGGATVLVAEDNPDLRRFLAELLAQHYTVALAHDGPTALEQVRSLLPDLVLTDVMMPGLDGFGLLAALRGDPATATIPVIMLSARAGEEATAQGLAAGADDYLIKPFSSAELLVRVRSNLVLSRLRSHEGAWRGAMMNALQDGFFVITASGEVVETNDAFTAMLGYGPEGLPYAPPHPWWPDPTEDPEAFADITRSFAEAQRSGRGRYLLPLRHRDGHRVWADCSADSVPDRDGNGTLLIGLARDVTAAHRTEQRERLLAETGRVLTRAGGLAEQLQELLALAVPVLADVALASLAGPDGSFSTVAATHRSLAELAAAGRTSAAHGIPDTDQQAFRAGRAFVLDAAPDPVLREWGIEVTEQDPPRSVLIAPMVMAGRHLGSLAFVAKRRGKRAFDAVDMALAEELGRRVAGMIDSDRVATREHQLHTTTSALAAAATVGEAATALATGVTAALGSAGIAIYLARPDEDRLDLVHTLGYPPEVAEAFGSIRADAVLPVADAARRGTPVWLGDRQAWRSLYPHMAVAPADDDAHAVIALPLTVGDRVVGVLAASFPTSREFPPDECGFALTLVGQAAQAFDRAAVADLRWDIAQTLQRSLLPPAMPRLPRLALAARYLPAAEGTQAGGDWYDVLELDDHRVAIVVGDVVGHGPAAAAVMGQLRSALGAYLLEGHAPAPALGLLTRFARRVPGARASTAICLVLHRDTGEVRWARAGHPPPLLIGRDGARYLEDAAGCVLGIADAPAFTEGHAVLEQGSSVLLYTDGLVERRGEIIDDGLDRLVAVTASHHASPPTVMTTTVLERMLDSTGAADDIAVVVARFRPAPLHRTVPARPDQLAVLRRATRAWAEATALPTDLIDDLLLALGEAVANSVEHGYLARDPRNPGTVVCDLEHVGDTDVQVDVRDDGAWRPVPADNGYRGRGLALIRAIAQDVSLDTTGPGTHLTFTLRAPARDTSPAGAPAAVPRLSAPIPPLDMKVHHEPDLVRLQLCGELDLAATGPLRAMLLEQLRSADRPVSLDTRDITYISSAGVDLIVEVTHAATTELHLLIAPGSATARVLTHVGLDRYLHAVPRRGTV